MKRLHLGCGKSPLPTSKGWVNLDQSALPGVDVVADLGKCSTEKLPFDDDTFDELYGSHVIEHIVDTLSLMQELHRVSKNGAKLLFKCPYGSSDDAWENPTHVRPYFLHSFGYFGQPFYWRESYGYTGDWQTERIQLVVRKELFKPDVTNAEVMASVSRDRNVVAEMRAFLRCIKPIREPKQENIRHPKVELVLA